MKYMNIFYSIIIMANALAIFSSRNLRNNLISFTEDDIISTIISDNETEFMNAVAILNKKGGIIYIDTPVISLKKNNIVRINWDFPGGIIGIKQEMGNILDLISHINILKKIFQELKLMTQINY